MQVKNVIVAVLEVPAKVLHPNPFPPQRILTKDAEIQVLAVKKYPNRRRKTVLAALAGFHPKKVLDRDRLAPSSFVKFAVHPNGIERLHGPHPNGLGGRIEILSRVLSVRLVSEKKE